jgi:hypothetical protein
MGFLKDLFAGSRGAESGKLGSDSDLIRQMLFASQSLEELTSRMKLDGKPGPLQSIADAHRQVVAGNRAAAIALLRAILEAPQLETRTSSWVWSALRELGEKPEPKSAFEVLGVVIEMPSGGAYDTLAAYVDGSARYLNFSGKAIFWDAPDPVIKQLCLAMVGSSISPNIKTRPRMKLSLPKRGVQATLLTRSGPFITVGVAPNLLKVGAVLMQELIKRASASKAASGAAPANRPENS